MDKLVLTESQEAIVKNLSADEASVFKGLKPSDQLAFITRVSLRTSVIDGEEFTTGDVEAEEVPLLSFATENNPLGIQAGEIIRGKLLGYMPIFSPEHKENWEKIICKETGEVFYKNGYFKFEAEDGSVFGLRDASALHKLKKIATMATDPLQYVNPKIAVKYEGKFSKADAKKLYGIEMTQGKEIHVCTYNLGDAVVLYTKGIVNYLDVPTPRVKSNDTRDAEQIAMDNYKAQAVANRNAQALRLESSVQ